MSEKQLPTSSSSSSDETVGETFNRPFPHDEVLELARQLSRISQTSLNSDSNPFDAEPGGVLDPTSPRFSSKAWARAMLKLNRAPMRTSGISFKNLSVYGFGTKSDYQKTVGTMGFQMVEGIKGWFGGGTKRRVDILWEMDGLVKAGEMCVVLGPPGRCFFLLSWVERSQKADDFFSRGGQKWMYNFTQDD